MFRNTAHLGKDSLAVESVTLMTIASTKAYHAALLYFVANPCTMGQKTSTIYHEDGLLIVEQGRILDIGPSKALLAHLSPDIPVTHYPHALIVPGFIEWPRSLHSLAMTSFLFIIATARYNKTSLRARSARQSILTVNTTKNSSAKSIL